MFNGAEFQTGKLQLSGDGCWLELYNNGNVLTATELYS